MRPGEDQARRVHYVRVVPRNYVFLIVAALVVSVVGCVSPPTQRNAPPRHALATTAEAEAAMSAYCGSVYHAEVSRYKVADQADGIGNTRNADEHLLIGQCKLGDTAFSERNTTSAFFYDRKTRRLVREETWFKTTPCRQWDPDSTSLWCRAHRSR